MEGYDVGLLNYGLVPVVIVIVDQLKKKVRKRWIPLLPFSVSAPLVALTVISLVGWPGWPVFLARTAVETVKVAFASMGLFKLYWTTIKGE